mmetsp:Transcript_11248/g.19957  ORF Transcript_11248/g.19957 Transcript_11248/m.19957 type:complete len:92 (-) Transcript_11248:43-318(-)
MVKALRSSFVEHLSKSTIPPSLTLDAHRRVHFGDQAKAIAPTSNATSGDDAELLRWSCQACLSKAAAGSVGNTPLLTNGRAAATKLAMECY